MTTSRPNRLLLLLLAGLLLGAGMLALPASSPAAKLRCPATFQVLHNDSIGKLQLQKGHYRITVLGARRLSCARAADLFARFLEDYDGNLPGKWRVIVRKAKFVRGSSGVGFKVKRVGSGGGGNHPGKGGRRCPGTFEVLHNDRIGNLRLPKGPYYLTQLSRTSPTCSRISDLFAKFLEDVDGNLPPNWRLVANKGTFIKRGSGGNKGFRVKPA